jgi:hypothetical protein
MVLNDLITSTDPLQRNVGERPDAFRNYTGLLVDPKIYRGRLSRASSCRDEERQTWQRLPSVIHVSPLASERSGAAPGRFGPWLA